MSLNRVGSIETLAALHTRRRGSDASIQPRKLSFNPVPQDWALSSDADPRKDDAPTPPSRLYNEPVSAFEVPQWKRVCE